MPATRPTEARIKAHKPTRSARDISDSALKGYGIWIMPSGRRHAMWQDLPLLL